VNRPATAVSTRYTRPLFPVAASRLPFLKASPYTTSSFSVSSLLGDPSAPILYISDPSGTSVFAPAAVADPGCENVIVTPTFPVTGNGASEVSPFVPTPAPY